MMSDLPIDQPIVKVMVVAEKRSIFSPRGHEST